ncbi:hypothetical protein ACTXT7_015581 [Hymenolepis weldensis]
MALQGSVLYGADVEGQKFSKPLEPALSRYAAKSSKVETGPLNITLASHRLEIVEIRRSNPLVNKTFIRKSLWKVSVAASMSLH